MSIKKKKYAWKEKFLFPIKIIPLLTVCRLERNQARESSIANMEYLKNVVFKFLTFSSVEERSQLLPVLSTMLKLSPHEQSAIMDTKGRRFSFSTRTQAAHTFERYSFRKPKPPQWLANLSVLLFFVHVTRTKINIMKSFTPHAEQFFKFRVFFFKINFYNK